MSSMTLCPYGVVRDANGKRGSSSSETMWLLLIFRVRIVKVTLCVMFGLCFAK